MATLKRQKADGTWEYVEVVGADIVNSKQDKTIQDKNTSVKYQLVVIDGKPFLEVVSV